MRFISEDGAQSKEFDFGRLPGNEGIRHDLAVAFEDATGVLGVSKRLRGAAALWQAARHACCWLADNRPEAAGLADLSAADARLLALSCRVPSGPGPAPGVKTLLRCSPVVSDEVRQAFGRVRHPKNFTARQPYSAEEFRRINVVARAVVRRARTRLRAHWEMVADYRSGRFDHLARTDPGRSLAEVLDHCAREGDFPRSASGARAAVTRRAVTAAGGGRLLPLLHLAPSEAWAFAVLHRTRMESVPTELRQRRPHRPRRGQPARACRNTATGPGQPGTA